MDRWKDRQFDFQILKEW